MNDFLLFYIIKKVLSIGLGIILFLAGVAGFVFPLIPGLLLIALGLLVLSRHNEYIRNTRLVKRLISLRS